VIYLDETRKSEAIEAGFTACKEELSEYKDNYFKVVQDWNPVAVCDDDKVIGTLISKDNVIHLAILPEYRGKWASRRIIREMLKYGKTTNESSKQDFVERIGFVKTGSMYELKETSWHF
jgi:GNAT superfamily N-acetyltransferase